MFFPVFFSAQMLVFFVSWFIMKREAGRSRREVVIFLLTLFFLPFLHPLAVIAPLGYLIFYYVQLLKLEFRKIKFGSRKISQGFQQIYPAFFILLAGWFAWFSTFRIFGTTVNHLIRVFRDGIAGFNSLESYIAASERASLGFGRMLSLIIFTYGPGGGLVLLALASVIIFKLRKSRGRNILGKDFGAFQICILVFSGLAVGSLFRDLITADPLRYLNFSVVLVPLVVGPIINNLLGEYNDQIRVHYKSMLLGFVPIAIIIVAVLSIYNLYYSSLTGQPNNQYSYARAAGAKFFLDHVSDEFGGIYSISARERIFRGVRPVEDVLDMIAENKNLDVKIPPPHFGYGENIDESFEDPEYLFITGYGMAYYTELWTSGGLYTLEDFNRLDIDPRWNRVYESGDFILWVWRYED
jgi:hypothetical protein